MPVTKDQAQQIAALAAAIRPHGARRWDQAGIVHAIGRVQHMDLGEVAMVVICAAADRKLDTPAAIGNVTTPIWQQRWRNPEPVTAPISNGPANRCGICSQPEHRCRAHLNSGHEFISALDHLRNVRRDADSTEETP